MFVGFQMGPDNHRCTFRPWNHDHTADVQFEMETLEYLPKRWKSSSTLLWIDHLSVDQESNSCKTILIPRMTVCYGLSDYDNNNHFNRILTFQEFPPSICGFLRRNRFPALLQVVSGIVTFTPAESDRFKMLVLQVMQISKQLHKHPLNDQRLEH